ncbi:MAG: CGNR zinc finger domain-containing protein [Acidimicrobiales bacterium]|jgi:predicted RNA-binding Zn ribbon-like protein
MALPSWVPHDETKPAPMPLLVVQSFVNTWEADSGVDLLADPPAASLWLRDAGLIGPDVEDVDAATAREVREGIRALLVHNDSGEVPDPSAVGALDALAERSRLRAGVLPDGTVELQPGVGGFPALARLLLIIRDAQRDGTWGRLKACRNPDCRWAYYDRSHAGRGAWCDMAVCGNRIKNRKLRSRRSGVGGATREEVSDPR